MAEAFAYRRYALQAEHAAPPAWPPQTLRRFVAQAPGPYRLRSYEWLLLGVLTVALHAAVIVALAARQQAVLPPVPMPVAVSIEFAHPPAPPVEQPAEPPAPAEAPPPVIDEVAPPPPPKPAPKPKPVVRKKPPVQSKPAPSAPRPAENSLSTLPAAKPTPAPAPLVPPSANAAYLRNPAPDYPAAALKRGWQGTVLLQVQVRADGTPQSIRLQKSSGYGVLDEAAKAAVQRWTFVPAQRGGKPEAGWVTVPINFNLTS
ncbi:TonB family protein [Gibbsiella quercinecans]|uniref:energy transducer TonB n=1 Tax=Gibbsiella quercinecans TaxID=929813 RepID=UPI003A4DC574